MPADTVYSDAYGQSEAVFAFTYLNDIQLMPRICNWKDLKFYKPGTGTRYKQRKLSHEGTTACLRQRVNPAACCARCTCCAGFRKWKCARK